MKQIIKSFIAGMIIGSVAAVFVVCLVIDCAAFYWLFTGKDFLR